MQQFESLADSSRIHQALELGHYRSQQDLRDRELENVIDAAKNAQRPRPAQAISPSALRPLLKVLLRPRTSTFDWLMPILPIDDVPCRGRR